MAPLKRSVSDLALFGGAPTLAEPLPVGRPHVPDRARFYQLCDEAFDRRRLSNHGPLVRRFEAEIARVTGAPHCVAVANATVGLQVVARALDLTGEVIVPAFTFAATAQALLWLGLRPVPCDVDRRTHQLDLERAAELITPRTSALVGVHLWGEPCDPRGLERLARSRGLALFFDAAHALGTTCDGVPVGRFGDAEVFSFHATKFVNSFEGGAVCTSNARLADRIRRMINFGFNEAREVVDLGTNSKLSEISAAMGIVGFEHLPATLEANRQRRRCYETELAGVPGLTWRPPSTEARNHQYVVGELEAAAGISRDDLLALLPDENVAAARYFAPGLHRMAPLAQEVAQAGRSLPATDYLAGRVLQLPTGAAVELADVRKICELIHFVSDHREEIAERMRCREGGASSDRHDPAGDADRQIGLALRTIVSSGGRGSRRAVRT